MYLFNKHLFYTYCELEMGGKGVFNLKEELNKYTNNAKAWINGEEREMLNVSCS